MSMMGNALRGYTGGSTWNTAPTGEAGPTAGTTPYNPTPINPLEGLSPERIANLKKLKETGITKDQLRQLAASKYIKPVPEGDAQAPAGYPGSPESTPAVPTNQELIGSVRDRLPKGDAKWFNQLFSDPKNAGLADKTNWATTDPTQMTQSIRTGGLNMQNQQRLINALRMAGRGSQPSMPQDPTNPYRFGGR